MDDDLVQFYKKELNYLRHSAGDFAQNNPKIAGRIGLSDQGEIKDPHVSRLIQSVALLNARIRKKLDDDFPELAKSLLDVLYPHYLAPIPSMSIVQFACSPDLTTGYTIERGTRLETEPVEGTPCQFKTTQPITLLPITVEKAELIRGAFDAPALPNHQRAVAVLRINLRCLSADMNFAELNPDNLLFYLAGQSSETSALYELIFNHVIQVAIANDAHDPHAVLLDGDAIEAVGFDKKEGLLPYPARSLLGYRLLTEFFVFPEKFNFFRIVGLEHGVFVNKGQKISLYLYLNESHAALEQSVNAGNFRLGCSPVVNLFSQYAEPITLTQRQSEYRVTPDSRRLFAKEVYAIEKVEALSPSGERIEYRPFYGFNHHHTEQNRIAYWHASRKSTEQKHHSAIDHGTELYMSLVDLEMQPDIPENWVLNIKITGLNRDLPSRIPYGGGRPKLQLGEGNAPLSALNCITAPTPTRRTQLGNNVQWRLISHLSLNHVSLFDEEEGVTVLKEILTLYNFDNSPSTQSMINGVMQIESQPTVAQVRCQGKSVMCRGLEITLTLNENRYEGHGMFLFANVLERFFALYAPINSFTQLILKTTQRELPVKTWPPRAGEKVLL